MLRRMACLAFIALLAAASPALAGGGLPLFEDGFAAPGPVWGDPDPRFTIGGGELTIQPSANRSFTVMERARSFGDMDFSATIRFDAAPELSVDGAGLVFWARDLGNYYLFMLTADGYGGVARLQDGAWTEIVPAWPAPTARAGVGASNDLYVTTMGSSAVLRVNGADFATIDGDPPPQGSRHIGFLGASSAGGTGRFAFSHLALTLPDSIPAGTIYASLFQDGLGSFLPEGYSVEAVRRNPSPERGAAELTFDLASDQDGATGSLVYRFYASEAEAEAYLSGDTQQPYADEAMGQGELVSFGHSNFAGDSTEFRWMWKMLPKPGAEWVRSIAREGSLIVMATLELPRAKVRADSELRDGSLERAIRLDAGGLRRAQAVEDAMPRPAPPP